MQGSSRTAGGPTAGGHLCIGDAAAMIAPLAGDGMAMALRSASLAAPLVARRVAGELDEPALLAAYRLAWRREFRRRLRVARVLDVILMRHRLAAAGLGLVRRAPGVGGLLIRTTRGAA